MTKAKIVPFVVYPNPTSGQVVIKLGEPLWGEEVEVFIYAFAGRLIWAKKEVLEQSNESLSAYLQASREGVYLLQVKVRDQLMNLRVIRK